MLRAYGAEVVVCPTAVRARAPATPTTRCRDRLVARDRPGAWKPNQYANPNNPRSHYETTGPEIWEQTDGRITHFVAGVGTGGTISGAGRYLKEVIRRAGAGHRRRPGGLGLLRRHRPAVPRRGRRRGLLAGRPTTGRSCDEIVAVSDARLVRDDPAAGPRGGAARRRLVRHGGRRGAAGGRAAAARTTSSSCCCPTAAAATCRRSSTTTGWPTTASCDAPAADDGRATCCARKGAQLPELVHAHPNETVREAIDILREYGVSQMPVVKAEPPVMAAEVVGSVVERDLLDALFAGHARAGRPARAAHVAAAADRRRGRAGRRPRSRRWRRPTPLLVLDDGKPAGVLTRQDLLTHLSR